MRASFLKLSLTAILFCASHAQSQVSQLSATEIEKRNAAAAFANTREATLFVLLGECKHLMLNSNQSMEMIAKGWFERNQPELEAAVVWIDQYLTYLQTTDKAAWQRASNELVRSQGDSVLQYSRIHFARKLPDLLSCEKAAAPFKVSQLDFKNIASNPGYEKFAEFPETLIRIRNETAFTVPKHLKFGMDKGGQAINGMGNIASLDAAEAAKEKGDGPGRGAIFMAMAKRGDGAAAQQVGIMYLNGQQVEKNINAAYRWFYAAWTLSDMDGLNAMGVMLRDGLGVTVNLPLAQAAFYLAKTTAKNKAAFDRASNNADKLAGQITTEEKSKIACMTLTGLDDALRAPIQTAQPLVLGKPIANPSRQLGSIVKDLSPVFQSDSCK